MSLTILVRALGLAVLCLTVTSVAQETATPNGIVDSRRSAIALSGVTVYVGDGEYRPDAAVLMRDGSIVDVTSEDDIPDDYFVMPLPGRYVYPGFIDLYSGYGLPPPSRPAGGGGAEVVESGPRALNVNDAIKSHYRAVMAFEPARDDQVPLRRQGFTTVASFMADGIARGTSVLVNLDHSNANEAVLASDVAAYYSLDKGSSRQTVPVSLMGAIALLRQTYLDAEWYAQHDPRPFADESLEGWLRTQSLPQIMEVDDWHQALAVHRVAEEFSTRYILKVGTDAYQQAARLAATGAPLIVSVDYPETPEVADPFTADDVSFTELKHWELAPYNLRLLHEQGIQMAITRAGSGDEFIANLRKAVNAGLPEEAAIAALTSVPAALIGEQQRLGHIGAGALANLVVSDGPLFESDTRLLETWVAGSRYVVSEPLTEQEGRYQLATQSTTVDLALRLADGRLRPQVLEGGSDTPLEGASATVTIAQDLINLTLRMPDEEQTLRLSGWPTQDGWEGSGWTLARTGQLPASEEADAAEEVEISTELPSPVIYPFAAYGSETVPTQQATLIRGATVWTNEDAGTLITDVLLRDGRIADVGENLQAGDAVVVDGTGMHLTPGIIDEHTHIALFGINEVATNSSMVRMTDVVNSQDVNIYRNLAGGVVAAQQLHGSANPIGGQSSLIKMRWGGTPDELQIENAPGFIKFALGENVKRSTNPASIRYPQTRMGVEQVFANAFSQAREYESRWQQWNSLSNSARRDAIRPRRDLVDETMLEVLNGERYVTAHSYVQSEINMLIHIADNFDFTINTFTHILEGYKVADKMAAHGAGGSTFSDWWAYKWEVRYAIPYNAALMQQAGVVVALNSDDAEMSRRLNQEAGKMVKYGGVSESDALKMITLNPARLLHLDDRMGSIRAGKDADVVLWDQHPLSVYAQAQTTWVDGIPYFDRDRDRELRQYMASERERIINVILSEQE
jgi:imidazolonepropionase-like amidohydrolase